MREDIQRIMEDAERKQAAYAARRQWWTREPERGPPFKPCAKCEAVQDVALLCGPCAKRASATMRALVRERAAMRSALRDLVRWGGQIPAPNDAPHRLAGYLAFDKAKRARNGKR